MLEKLQQMAALPYAATREMFFQSLAGHFPQSDDRYHEIERAYEVANTAFKDKKRDDGEDYMGHLRAVALILVVYLRQYDEHLIIAALLHDLVEDCPDWTVERVRKEFGPRVALWVDYMTKSPSEKNKVTRDKTYHSRFRNAPREFFLIKLADRLHNMLTILACTVEKRRRKIEETRVYYMPYAEKHWILLYELEEALELAERSLLPPPTRDRKKVKK